MLLLLLACAKVPEPPPRADPASDWASVAARASTVAAGGAVAAKFDIHLLTGDKGLNAQGALVVRPPDDVRIEVSGPIGPPQLIIVSDGAAISVWMPGKQTFLRADDAEATLRDLTGGVAGAEAVALLLLGQLADLGVPATDDAAALGDPWTRAWRVPDRGLLVARADRGALVELHARDASGADLLDLHLDAGRPYPKELHAELPTLRTSVDLDFGAWKPATPPDAAFTLNPPFGVPVRPLALGPAAPASPEAPVEPPGP